MTNHSICYAPFTFAVAGNLNPKDFALEYEKHRLHTSSSAELLQQLSMPPDFNYLALLLLAPTAYKDLSNINKKRYLILGRRAREAYKIHNLSKSVEIP